MTVMTRATINLLLNSIFPFENEIQWESEAQNKTSYVWPAQLDSNLSLCQDISTDLSVFDVHPVEKDTSQGNHYIAFFFILNRLQYLWQQTYLWKADTVFHQHHPIHKFIKMSSLFIYIVLQITKVQSAKNKSMQLLLQFPLGCFKIFKWYNSWTRNNLRGGLVQILFLWKL